MYLNKACFLLFFTILISTIPSQAIRPSPQQTASTISVEFDKNRITVNAKEYPFSAIGRLNASGINRRSHCTATLITPNHILTAAHCLYFKARKRWFLPNELHFLAGYEHGNFIKHSKIKAITAKGNYNPNQSSHHQNILGDWAILSLQEPLNIQPILLHKIAGSKAAFRLLQSGYHKQRPHVQTSNPNCMIRSQFKGLFIHNCILAPGDSGSPILYKQQEQYYLVGLNSASIQHHEAGKFGLAVSSHTFMNVIDQAGRN